ncbi:hypothetical protein J6590_102851 [Homalodisca vitripennis]|nr:hypothetical protein J6590_102851 [Homalodisca vitripennis]
MPEKCGNARAINVPYKDDEISFAYRMKLFSSRYVYPPIRWIAVVKEKKGLDATEISTLLQPGPVYISEQLTSRNKARLARAKRLMKEKKLHFAGFFNGKVLVCHREGNEPVRVTTIEDLDRYGL